MQELNINQRALLVLLQHAMSASHADLPEADWEAVDQYAREQGVQWMAYVGSRAFGQTIPPAWREKWRTIAYSGVVHNARINRVQATLVQWLAQQGIRAAILKGTSCSRYYRVPDLRPLGDIDILVDQENVPVVGAWLEAQGYEAPRKDHSFHVSYYGKDAVIEVHHTVTRPPASKGGSAVVGETAHFLDEAHTVSSGDISFPALSESHQALMLLLHTERHMVESGIGLRQLSDWAAFVNGSSDAHWETRTLPMLERCGLLVFAKVLTKACITYIGLNADKAKWAADAQDDTVRALMADVFRGGNMGRADAKGMGSLFTERASLGNPSASKMRGFAAKLSGMACRRYPFLERKKMLIPVVLAYMVLRYFVRSLLGLRPKRNVVHVLSAASRRHELYRELRLYEVE